MITLLSAVPRAHALTLTGYTVSGTVDSTLCTNNGGSWDPTSSSCTIPMGIAWEVASSTTLTIPAGVSITGPAIGRINNLGTIDISGAWNVQSSEFDSEGTLTIESSGALLTQYELNIFGSLSNSGFLENSCGALDNRGTFSNSGTFINEGSPSGCYPGFRNFGALTNTGTIDNNYNLENSGTIENYGTISNTGNVAAGDSFINECGGQLVGLWTSPWLLGSITQVACSLVPEFPVAALGPLIITALLFPALLVMRRSFSTPD